MNLRTTDIADLPTALIELGGVATRGELVAAVGRSEFQRALDAGEVLKVERGRYVAPGGDATMLAARTLNAVVSHLSAAQHWGWKVKAPTTVPCLTVPPGRNLSANRRKGLELHYSVIPETEVLDRVTSKVRTVLDCARALDFDAALAVADSALRDGVIASDLRVAAQAVPRTGRARAIRVVEEAFPQAANPFESVLRAIALDVPGLRVLPQLTIPSIGRVDLADHRLRIVVEADSYEFHSPPDAFRADVRRYTALIRSGWLVARFTWDDVMHQQSYVSDVLADLVRIRRG